MKQVVGDRGPAWLPDRPEDGYRSGEEVGESIEDVEDRGVLARLEELVGLARGTADERVLDRAVKVFRIYGKRVADLAQAERELEVWRRGGAGRGFWRQLFGGRG